MKIISLLENTPSSPAVACEHGLSLYIETDTRRILFDMGQTDLFARNAETLGVDLSAVDTAILSHGHYDHGGGLSTFLAVNSAAPIYLSSAAFRPHYNAAQKNIGLDTSLSSHPRLRAVDGDLPLGDGLTLLSPCGRPRRHSLGSFGLTERVGDTFIPDDFRHEQYLLIQENTKRVLVSGCSHAGILDIVEWFTPDVLVGGFHVSKMLCGEDLAAIARSLAARETDYYTCHCTGVEQYGFMGRYMPRLRYLACGESIVI
jgi:7,8-dihydropterin-6-yl-methyl-4-(beta-D-ribofuranosyl)aminobenzene 5'-phosphate synthase